MGICLDRFYESGASESLIGLLGVVVGFASVIGIMIWAILVFNKMFRLFRKFKEVSQEEIPKIKGSK